MIYIAFYGKHHQGGRRPNGRRHRQEQEMARDMMTNVHCFSRRLVGLRNDRKKLSEALKQDADGHAAGTSHPA